MPRILEACVSVKCSTLSFKKQRNLPLLHLPHKNKFKGWIWWVVRANVQNQRVKQWVGIKVPIGSSTSKGCTKKEQSYLDRVYIVNTLSHGLKATDVLIIKVVVCSTRRMKTHSWVMEADVRWWAPDLQVERASVRSSASKVSKWKQDL